MSHILLGTWQKRWSQSSWMDPSILTSARHEAKINPNLMYQKNVSNEWLHVAGMLRLRKLANCVRLCQSILPNGYLSRMSQSLWKHRFRLSNKTDDMEMAVNENGRSCIAMSLSSTSDGSKTSMPATCLFQTNWTWKLRIFSILCLLAVGGQRHWIVMDSLDFGCHTTCPMRMRALAQAHAMHIYSEKNSNKIIWTVILACVIGTNEKLCLNVFKMNLNDSNTGIPTKESVCSKKRAPALRPVDHAHAGSWSPLFAFTLQSRGVDFVPAKQCEMCRQLFWNLQNSSDTLWYTYIYIIMTLSLQYLHFLCWFDAVLGAREVKLLCTAGYGSSSLQTPMSQPDISYVHWDWIRLDQVKTATFSLKRSE